MAERIIVAVIVLTMVFLLVRSLYRSWSGKDGGCVGCAGCASKAQNPPNGCAATDKTPPDAT